MKVILDTNVIISSIFFGGIPSHILEVCYEKRYYRKIRLDCMQPVTGLHVAEGYTRSSPSFFLTDLG